MSLHDAFIDELRDTYDAEKQLIKALPKMAKAATWHPLRAAFERHLEETRLQAQRLERVFESIGEKARGKHCDGMAGIIEEGKSAMEEDFDESTMDAVLVASAQRAEHYEMAAYGTLVAWAKAMGHEEAARLLEQNLGEEKATDEKLTQIAESGINREAARAAHSREEGASTRRGGRKAGGRKSAGRKTAPRKGGAKKGGRKAAKRGGKKAAKGRR
jgi:ferritin-like metal-binding protein YciE